MLAALFLLCAPARASAPEQAWKDLAAEVRAEPADLGLRPERSDARLTLKTVEALLADPLEKLPELRRWRSILSSPLTGADLLRLGTALTDQTLPPTRSITVACPQLPPQMRPTIEKLAAGLAAAQALAGQAANSLDSATRAQAQAQISSIALNEDVPLDTGLFDKLKNFRQDQMTAAAVAAAQAIDDALPALKKIAAQTPVGRWTCGTPAGPVIITGAQGTKHGPDELSQSLLVIGLGGKSRYEGPAAAAGPGQARVVIDYGETVFESTGPTAGSGLFGVGLLYLPSQNPVAISAGDFSIGAGFFGAGAAFINAPRAKLMAGRFAEGAGAFGLGLLSLSGDGDTATADLSAQGFGLTRGAGLLLARGNGGTLNCGLKQADPREDLALLSLCQGVGYGPRAYAAGGVGLADVQGSSWTLASSYFAQGAGYWHALGALMLSGNDESLQARRYSQGSGVHLGAGALLLHGDGARLANWGVGPGYGWDLGLGVFEADGDGGSYQADWSAGRAEFNGRSLFSLRGNNNSLHMPGLGTADFRRGMPGYALADVSGRGNRVWLEHLQQPVKGPFDMAGTPWGILRLEGDGSLEPQVSTRAISWPAVDHAAAAARDEQAAKDLSPRPETGAPALAWDLFTATHFPFAPRPADQAAERLLSLSPEQAGDLLANFTPERFDEGLWVRLAFAGLGPSAETAVGRRVQETSGLPRALALGLMRWQSAVAAVPGARAALDDPDWRVRKEAVGVIGYALARQGGEEPGRLVELQMALNYFSQDYSSSTMADRLGRLRPVDALALLALANAPTSAQRLDLVGHAPGPFDPMWKSGLENYARLLKESRDALKPAFEQELAQAGGLGETARSSLIERLNEPDVEAKTAVLVALGLTGDARNAPVLADYLNSPRAALREAAAYGLAELGAGASPAISAALDSLSPLKRAGALLSAAQSTDPNVLKLLDKALQSRDPNVRRLACASLSAVQAPLQPNRARFLPALRALANNDSSASVRASAAAAIAQIGPETKP